MEKFAVYTTIFGERDDLREPLCDNVEYIVFTDRPIESERARIIRMTSPYKDPARGSRFVRCHPHKFLAEYDVTLWLDASFVLKSVDGLLDYLGQHDLAISKHFSRDCIYEEAKVASRLGRDRPEIIETQMERYKKEGYPAANGLVATGAILRRNSEPVRRFNELWSNEIEQGSRHCQLSFNYVLWKLGLEIRLFEWPDLRKTRFWTCTDHSGAEPPP